MMMRMSLEKGSRLGDAPSDDPPLHTHTLSLLSLSVIFWPKWRWMHGCVNSVRRDQMEDFIDGLINLDVGASPVVDLNK